MPILTIVCGLPGAGKTEYAHSIGCLVIEPGDNYMFRNGKHTFDNQMAYQGHVKFVPIVEKIMKDTGADLAVVGMFCKLVFFNQYLELAQKHGYKVKVVHIKTKPEVAVKYSTRKVPYEFIQMAYDTWVPRKVDEVIDRTRPLKV